MARHNISSSVENINLFNLHEAEARLKQLAKNVEYFEKPNAKFRPADALQTTRVKIIETLSTINKLYAKVKG